jgi:hypothetical protein
MEVAVVYKGLATTTTTTTTTSSSSSSSSSDKANKLFRTLIMVLSIINTS